MAPLFVTAAPGVAAFGALLAESQAAFEALPVAVIDADQTVAEQLRAITGLTVTASRFDSYLPLLRYLDHMARGSARWGVANISISHGPGHFDPAEAMNVATRMAAEAGQLIVLAMGNDGPADASNSRWAAAPWVIRVGAADAEGTAMLPMSSVGSPAQPASWPDVVAHGETIVPLKPFEPRAHGTMVALVIAGKEGPGRAQPGYRDTPMAGTSVAAPRVSRIVAVLASLLRIIDSLHRAVFARMPDKARLSDYLKACEVLGEGPVEAPDNGAIDGMPPALSGPLLGWLARAALAGRWVHESRAVDDTPRQVAIVRRMLAAMARPLPGVPPHRAGAGFVSDAIADAWLAGVSGAQLLALIRGDEVQPGDFGAPLSPGLLDILKQQRDGTQLFDAPVI